MQLNEKGLSRLTAPDKINDLRIETFSSSIKLLVLRQTHEKYTYYHLSHTRMHKTDSLSRIYATMVTIVSHSRPTKSNTKDVTFYYIRYGTLPASITGHLRARSSTKKEIRIYA